MKYVSRDLYPELAHRDQALILDPTGRGKLKLKKINCFIRIIFLFQIHFRIQIGFVLSSSQKDTKKILFCNNPKWLIKFDPSRLEAERRKSLTPEPPKRRRSLAPSYFFRRRSKGGWGETPLFNQIKYC